MNMTIEWRRAAGSCGINIGKSPVEAAYVNGVALFAFESRLSTPEAPFYSCAVTGHMTCGGNSLEEAKLAGECAALRIDQADSDVKMTKQQFEKVVATA